MSPQYMGHKQLLEARKILASSGFITQKEANQPSWDLFVFTGEEPGRDSGTIKVGRLFSLKRRADVNTYLPSNITFKLLFAFDSPQNESMLHSFWMRDFARHQRSIQMCRYHAKSPSATSTKILEGVTEFKEDMKRYSEQVHLPDVLVKKSETIRHRSVLPFYLARATPEVCSAVLSLNVGAASPLGTALRESRITVEQAAEYADTPPEWLVPLLF